jgi:hypothetical protein
MGMGFVIAIGHPRVNGEQFVCEHLGSKHRCKANGLQTLATALEDSFVQNKEDRRPTNRDPKQGLVRGVKNNFKRKGRI